MKSAKTLLLRYTVQGRTSRGSLSAADIFTYLYFEEMNIDPKDPKNLTGIDLFCQKGIQHLGYILLWQKEDIFQRI
jgi:transketolase N-terminal domain/subunit